MNVWQDQKQNYWSQSTWDRVIIVYHYAKTINRKKYDMQMITHDEQNGQNFGWTNEVILINIRGFVKKIKMKIKNEDQEWK